MILPANILRPRYAAIPLRDGLRWRGGGFRYEEKMDGRWHGLGVGRSRIVGELMADGRFFAFDIPVHDGVDVRHVPLRDRLAILGAFHLLRPATGNGGEFLEAVLARGGEGVVAKHLDEPFGARWWKCKRVETFDVVVTEPAEECLSVGIGEWRNGKVEDAGRCPVFKLDVLENLKAGDVIEIAAQCRTDAGKFREPRFIRIRPDKSAA